MFYAPMVDLARSADDAKQKLAEQADFVKSATAATVEKYPYGMCIRMEDEVLEKLGLDGDLPARGALIQFCAVAKVTSVSGSEREGPDGKTVKSSCVELQIIEMGCGTPDLAAAAAQAGAARRKRAFPSMVADTDSDEE